MHVTTNERGAGDGHDIVIVTPAALVLTDSAVRACLAEVAEVIMHHGFFNPGNQLRLNIENAEDLAKPIQRHESAIGSDEGDY